jgi:mxaD protein
MNPVRSIAVAALAAASGLAVAAPVLKVDKSIEIDRPAALVWQTVKNFDRLDAWHPAVASDRIVEGSSNEVGAVRLLTLGDGGTIREKLLRFDDKGRSYEYEILEGVLPVSHYRSTIVVKEAGKDKSTVTWSGTFQRKDTGEHPGEKENDQAATTTMSAVYQGGLDNLKKKLEAK